MNCLKIVSNNNILIKFKRGDRYGFKTNKGNIIIDAVFSDARQFFEGFAAVKIHGTWTFIDSRGKRITNKAYSHVDDFASGVARVRIKKSGSMKDTFGQSYAFGYINSLGKEILKPEFEFIGKFYNGEAMAIKNQNGKEKKYRVDILGNSIVDPDQSHEYTPLKPCLRKNRPNSNINKI